MLVIKTYTKFEMPINIIKMEYLHFNKLYYYFY